MYMEKEKIGSGKIKSSNHLVFLPTPSMKEKKKKERKVCGYSVDASIQQDFSRDAS